MATEEKHATRDLAESITKRTTRELYDESVKTVLASIAFQAMNGGETRNMPETLHALRKFGKAAGLI